MAAWPGTLPTAPLLEEFTHEPLDQCVGTDMDSGPPQRRRRFSTAIARQTWCMHLTGTQRAAFESWYLGTLEGGAGVITGLNDPFDDVAATYQFAAAPQWSPVASAAAASGRLWKLRMVWDRVA